MDFSLYSNLISSIKVNNYEKQEIISKYPYHTSYVYYFTN